MPKLAAPEATPTTAIVHLAGFDLLGVVGLERLLCHLLYVRDRGCPSC